MIDMIPENNVDDRSTRNDSDWIPYGKLTIRFDPDPSVRDFFHGEEMPPIELVLDGKYRDCASGVKEVFEHLNIEVNGRRDWRFPVFGEEGEEWVRGLSTEHLEALDNVLGNLAEVVSRAKNSQYIEGFAKGGGRLGHPKSIESGEDFP